MNLFSAKILKPELLNLDMAKIDLLKAKAQAGLKQKMSEMAFFQVAADHSDIAVIEQLAAKFKSGLTDIVHIGCGGSSLGAQALAQLAGYGCVGSAKKQKFNIHFLDNLDAMSLSGLLETLPAETTGALIISKSGTTLETIALASVYLDWAITAQGEGGLAEHNVIITEPHKSAKNPIRQLAEKYSIPVMDHHEGIGGRFSVLSNVGLFVAALFGLDLMQIKQGAKSVIDEPNLAVEGAALSVYFGEQGQDENVIWAYMDRLKLFTAWYVQLWAESLGKDGKGLTPIASIGPVDQHSQQQLFLDGPKNKFITFITQNQAGQGNLLKPDIFMGNQFDYIQGRSIGDIVTAQQLATATTLADKAIPVRYIELKILDEKTLGALLMHYMCETIAAAELLNVDAFNQPAVEQSKNLTREYIQAMQK